MESKICPNCNGTFQAKTKRAIYCSNSCRVSYFQKYKNKTESARIVKTAKWLVRNRIGLWFGFFIAIILALIFIVVIIYLKWLSCTDS